MSDRYTDESFRPSLVRCCSDLQPGICQLKGYLRRRASIIYAIADFGDWHVRILGTLPRVYNKEYGEGMKHMRSSGVARSPFTLAVPKAFGTIGTIGTLPKSSVHISNHYHTMTNASFIESPAYVAKCTLTKETKEAMSSFALPSFALRGSFHSVSDDDASLPTAEPLSELQTLTSKVHRLLSFEKLDDCTHCQSETVQACSLSLRTRLPYILSNTGTGFEPDRSNHCQQQQSALALLRATHYIDRIEQGLNDVKSSSSVDEQLRTVLAGLDVQNIPESVRNQISFRLSPWVHGFDLPVGAIARLVLDDTPGKKRPVVVVEVEPIVEFRTGDVTSIKYATSAAKACAVSILSCKHVGCNVGSKAGIVGEGSIQIRIKPLGNKTMVDENGKALSLQIKEIRLYVYLVTLATSY